MTDEELEGLRLEYLASLQDLKINSKPIINNLTMIAQVHTNNPIHVFSLLGVPNIFGKQNKNKKINQKAVQAKGRARRTQHKASDRNRDSWVVGVWCGVLFFYIFTMFFFLPPTINLFSGQHQCPFRCHQGDRDTSANGALKRAPAGRLLDRFDL